MQRSRLCVIWTTALLLAVSLRLPAADVRAYTPQSTWHETMLSSLEALAASGLIDSFEPFTSSTMKGGDPPRRVDVSVAGASAMYLVVSGIPDVKWAVADWGDARVLISGRPPLHLAPGASAEVVQGRCERDLTLRSGLYQKMRLSGRVFERGLNVQADSIIRVPLPTGAERFEAWIGVDDWAGTNGTVRFSVLGPKSGSIQTLYAAVERDFQDRISRREMRREREDGILDAKWSPGDWRTLAQRYAQACRTSSPLGERARQLAAAVSDKPGMLKVRGLYHHSRDLETSFAEAGAFNLADLREAIRDLGNTYPDRYPKAFAARLSGLEEDLSQALRNFDPGRVDSYELVSRIHSELLNLQREALMANPLLDFDQLLVIKRVPVGGARRASWEGYGYGEFLGIPRQSSWNYGTMPNVDKWTNQIAILSPVAPHGSLTTFFQPPANRLVNDIDLHWQADKFLFSMPDTNRNWQVCEIHTNGTAFRQLTPAGCPDVHNYDGVYLPDGNIVFLSTAPLQGVPCNASVIVGMMYHMDGNGQNIRQLTFEQDHDYTPSILNDGRILYLRWDYTDTPHIWNRLLMSMNPDGTGQMEYLGANSYWPNAMFFARPIPNHPSRIVTIVTGHHEGRVGELFIMDPAMGRHETGGVVQRIPRRGAPVEAKLEDKLTEHSWPKFLHPWPLSDKYFLVACKPDPDALWGIYLVDVFDNMVLVKEEEGFALLEPVPLAARPLPPVIQKRTRPDTDQALVFIEDIYRGSGTRGVPPGTIKALRLFTYHFGYQKLAGIDHRVGADGPWEIKRVLGSVPVEADGSALFHVPARTPISFQPLDSQGKAVALMRSWMTAMPGENVSCVGCHDNQSTAPVSTDRRLALTRPPSEISPWRGPIRGFSFTREVQPVLDRYCVGCHDGDPSGQRKAPPNLRRDQGGFVVYRGGELDGKFMPGKTQEELLGKFGAVFEPSYVALRKYVRVGGLESDLHVLAPGEFGADTSELVRMLAKGHYNVQLDPEAWDRLLTWIDLNAPCHGTWGEVTTIPGNQCERRLELRKVYGGVVENAEEVTDQPVARPGPIMPAPEPERSASQVVLDGWPLSTKAAQRLQGRGGQPPVRIVDLGNGVKLDLAWVPAGSFVMGDPDGTTDERPARVVRVDKPFWMAKCEISNEQYAQFDRTHDSRFEHRSSWWFSEEYTGWRLNGPRQPVLRVSWQEAAAFCRWLSTKVGEEVTLPTEEQWEYACRAGSTTPLSYGGLDTDFSPFANMGDINLRRLADEGWRPKAPDLVPRDDRFNDGALVTSDIGSYAPNAWGLHDMHGNVAEWTRSDYAATSLGPAPAAQSLKTVRGGSWRDRPQYCRAASRWGYPPWRKVFNVGFRVIIDSSREDAGSN